MSKRYKVKRFSSCYLMNWVDNKTNKELTALEIEEILHKQEKRIAELEEQLKQQLGEKEKEIEARDKRIDILEENYYQETRNLEWVNEQLAEAEKQLAEKEKEIAYLTKQVKKFNNEAQKYFEDAYCNDFHNQDKISFCIEQLEKVKEFVSRQLFITTKDCSDLDEAQAKLEELKGDKDE